MARAPRSKVSKTSGQGVSRLSYQRSRGLTEGARVSAEMKVGEAPRQRDYGKSEYPKGYTVSYGDTYEPTDLKDLVELGKRKPPKSTFADKKSSKSYK